MLPERKNIRLQGYDYSTNGIYYITICTQGHLCLFGNIYAGTDSIPARMEMNEAGKMIESMFFETMDYYRNVNSDLYVIMPNHFHCILSMFGADIESAPTEHDSESASTISDVVQTFKRKSTIKYIDGVKLGIYPTFKKRVWQRSYHDRIIRNETEYQHIWQYIHENPVKWQEDIYLKAFSA